LVTIVGVSKPRTSGSGNTKKGKVNYRGERKHWYVYYYDDDGKFKKKKISAVQVPYYGSLIRRRKSYSCSSCGKRFRALEPKCPKCGARATKLTRKKGSGLAEPLKL
jgi:ABC-type ATPase with predicted acetyltransferase domain